MQFDEFDEFTRKLSTETQKTILSLYENPDLEIELKGDETPVTFADKETERQIREAIQVVFPDHGIKGEEYDDVNP
ncbi:MAG: inositol monophosphatase family protein, partial [Verrucomicrobiia bacterium]